MSGPYIQRPAADGDKINTTMAIHAILTSLICLAAAVAAVFAEYRGWHPGRAVLKVVASTAFVVLAIQSGALGTVYGRILLTALVLCWLGDLLLLSFQKAYFLLGTAAFLLGHIAFAAAFLFRPISIRALLIGIVIMGAFGVGMMAWLWKRLFGFFTYAVSAYVAAICLMSSLAIASSTASGSVLAAAGALAFAASDVSVARDRFIARRFSNYAWGLPLYYLAQILLAQTAAVTR